MKSKKARQIKAWAVVSRDDGTVYRAYPRDLIIKKAILINQMWCGCDVVPCTITIDENRRAK